MMVSVVLCAYDADRYRDLTEAIESIYAQTHRNVELLIVVDGTRTLFEALQDEYGDRSDTLIELNDSNLGLLESRNIGAELANGDIVAFIDDDAVADEEWLSELHSVYSNRNRLAVGGPMVGEWVAGKPTYLPEEFYWLVGVTHRGFRQTPGEVRNTFGSNLSFRRDVFLALDGFDGNIGGRVGAKNLQGGETELCARFRARYGEGVWFNPAAVVAHKVFEYRTSPGWLINRAFWQGYSKRFLERLVPESTDEETEFAVQLLSNFLPERIGSFARRPTLTAFQQLVMLVILTISVGLGYLYGLVSVEVRLRLRSMEQK